MKNCIRSLICASVTMFSAMGLLRPANATAVCTNITASADQVKTARSEKSLPVLGQKAADLAYGATATPLQTSSSHAVASALIATLSGLSQLTDGDVATKLTAGLKKACESIEAGDLVDATRKAAFTAASLNDAVTEDEAGRIRQEAAKFPSSLEEFGKGDRLMLRAHAPIFRPAPLSAGCAAIPIGAASENPRCLAPLGAKFTIDTPVSTEGNVRVHFTCVPGFEALEKARSLTAKRDSIGQEVTSLSALGGSISEEGKKKLTKKTEELAELTAKMSSESAGNNKIGGKPFIRCHATSDGETLTNLKVDYPEVRGVVQVGPEYEVELQELSGYGRHQFGWAYGALLIPYKFRPSDKSIASNTTVAGFIGRSFSSDGFQITPVLSAGLSTVPVSSMGDDGKTVTDNKTAASAAFGAVATFTRTGMFQAGVLFGWDWAGKDSGYQYNGKRWIAVSVGLDLTK